MVQSVLRPQGGGVVSHRGNVRKHRVTLGRCDVCGEVTFVHHDQVCGACRHASARRPRRSSPWEVARERSLQGSTQVGVSS